MRFIVTGASGYVGRFLCRRLVNSGHHVTAISRRGVYIEGVNSLCHDFSIEGEISLFPASVDVAINLVAQSNLGGAYDYFEINRDIPARLVSMCDTHDVRRIIHVSTIGVHGVSTKGRGAFSEADAPNPSLGDTYAISKLAGELAVVDTCKGKTIEYTILRPPAVYGPGASTFGKLVSLVRSGIPLPLAGIGNANSYLGIHNLVDCLLACAASSNAANETFVVSDGTTISTPDLAREIAIVLGISSRQFYLPDQLVPVRALKSSLAINSNKIRAFLNWSPPVSFRDGLKEAVEAFS